ncbi:hypothetical protein [Methanofollis liminatans]|uniref:hypothetical protein n=1 Tax=Methanofollis liminatans TaxID=2201 RepID=UPI00145F19F2|nr:hypothetical protein [Methanofollis liminatans]
MEAGDFFTNPVNNFVEPNRCDLFFFPYGINHPELRSLPRGDLPHVDPPDQIQEIIKCCKISIMENRFVFFSDLIKQLSGNGIELKIIFAALFSCSWGFWRGQTQKNERFLRGPVQTGILRR